MSQFTRELNEELQKQLKATDLYQDNLSEDIKKGNVFPAVRTLSELNTIFFFLSPHCDMPSGSQS